MAFLQPRTITIRDGLRISIRSPQPDDAAALLAYIRIVAAETPYLLMEAEEFNFPVEQEVKWIQDHLDRPGWIVLMGEVSDEIIGILNFENGLYNRTAHRGSFGVCVAKQWRNRGVGTALLEMLLQWAADNPLIDKVGMDVFASNQTAIGLYKKLGFVEDGVKLKEIKMGADKYIDTVSMYKFV